MKDTPLDADRLCGEDLAALVGSASPFSNVLFLDYYDGPTSGAVQYGSCAATYAYKMIAIDADGEYDYRSWDKGREIRIFSLAPLPDPAFRRFEQALSRPDARREQARGGGSYDELAAILGEARAPEAVIATHGIDSPIVAARAVETIDTAAIEDWFSFLGLVRQPV